MSDDEESDVEVYTAKDIVLELRMFPWKSGRKLYKGTFRRTDAVIKVYEFNKEIISDVESLFQILQEVNHNRFICQLYAGFMDVNIYLITEPCVGDLEHLFSCRIEWDSNIAFKHGLQLISAVDYIHQCGYLHNNIRPSNCLIDSALTLKLTDFESACLIADDKRMTLFKSKLTTEKEVNSSYLPREAILEHQYSKKSDVFSCGTCLYEFIVRKKLFPLNTWSREDESMTSQEGTRTYSTRAVTKLRLETLEDRLAKDKVKCTAIILKMVSVKPIDRPNCSDVLSEADLWTEAKINRDQLHYVENDPHFADFAKEMEKISKFKYPPNLHPTYTPKLSIPTPDEEMKFNRTNSFIAEAFKPFISLFVDGICAGDSVIDADTDDGASQCSSIDDVSEMSLSSATATVTDQPVQPDSEFLQTAPLDTNVGDNLIELTIPLDEQIQHQQLPQPSDSDEPSRHVNPGQETMLYEITPSEQVPTASRVFTPEQGTVSLGLIPDFQIPGPSGTMNKPSRVVTPEQGTYSGGGIPIVQIPGPSVPWRCITLPKRDGPKKKRGKYWLPNHELGTSEECCMAFFSESNCNIEQLAIEADQLRDEYRCLKSNPKSSREAFEEYGRNCNANLTRKLLAYSRMYRNMIKFETTEGLIWLPSVRALMRASGAKMLGDEKGALEILHAERNPYLHMMAPGQAKEQEKKQGKDVNEEEEDDVVMLSVTEGHPVEESLSEEDEVDDTVMLSVTEGRREEESSTTTTSSSKKARPKPRSRPANTVLKTAMKRVRKNTRPSKSLGP